MLMLVCKVLKERKVLFSAEQTFKSKCRRQTVRSVRQGPLPACPGGEPSGWWCRKHGDPELHAAPRTSYKNNQRKPGTHR